MTSFGDPQHQESAVLWASLVLKEGLKSDIEYRYNDFFNVNLCPNVH